MAVKFITKFKNYKAGDIASFDAAQEEWLVSRLYAARVDELASTVAPMLPEPAAKPLTTRSRGKK